jgi:sulfur transfer complex TusBCD TusB component (DsrH family)
MHMAKTLHIVDAAYRANIEEQDDPSLWFAAALQGAGANLAVLLQGNAVNYAVRGQSASGLVFGAKHQSQPPDPAADLARLIGKGVEVYVVADDVAERGLEGTELIEGIRPVARSRVPSLVVEHKRIWRL